MKWYLDFGHGGKDSGAIGTNKTKESDTVLKIGMLIKNNLEQAFEKVITTREEDKYYSLDYRSSKANKEVEKSLRNDNHLKNIADTISSTLLSFVNKSIVEDKVFYRVCIGSFSNKDNAVKLKNEAICKGFKDTHIYTT